MVCKHEWQEDEDFAFGAVVMMFGAMDNINQETRVVCRKCGEVNYVKKCEVKE